jgi:hypothetical protein
MEVTGKIKVQQKTETFGNDFTKCNLIITTDEQYPQDLCIEFVKDKIELLSSFKEGDEVKVSINLRGREWINPQGESKYFNSIGGWRIEKAESTNESKGANTPPPVQTEPDDLPF